jgi:hypothetical protein
MYPKCQKKTTPYKSTATDVELATVSSITKAMGVEKFPVIVLSNWEVREDNINELRGGG